MLGADCLLITKETFPFGGTTEADRKGSIRQLAHGRVLRAGAIWGNIQEAPISVWVGRARLKEIDLCKVVVLVVPEGCGRCPRKI